MPSRAEQPPPEADQPLADTPGYVAVGRIANAMRTLLKVAAIRKGARAMLEIG